MDPTVHATPKITTFDPPGSCPKNRFAPQSAHCSVVPGGVPYGFTSMQRVMWAVIMSTNRATSMPRKKPKTAPPIPGPRRGGEEAGPELPSDSVLPALDLVEREDVRVRREAPEGDHLLRREPPARRAWCEHMQEPRPRDFPRLLYLLQEVLGERDVEGRRVRGVVRRHDPHDVLLRLRLPSGLRPDGRRRRPRALRRRP